MKKIKYIFVVFFMILVSCDADDNRIAVALSNLTVSPEVSDDGSGKVVFRTSATGANVVKYDFGDGTTGESITGYTTHTYTNSGQNTYTVILTAIGSDGNTITETVDVTVDVPVMNSDLVNLLTKGDSKKWFLAASQAGHLGLGPARDGIDGDWWYPKWYSSQAFEKCGSEISDCFCDDELTFSVDSNGEVSYVLDNKGQTFFNVGHRDVVAGTEEEDYCYDYDTSGTKSVIISTVEGNVPEAETTGMQMDFSDGGFMSYYVGSSSYEILSISENLLYVRTYDTLNPDLAWYLKFSAEVSTDGGEESLETIFTNLVWSDEFDVDGTPNTDNWTYDLGAGGWGNGEAQTYTDNPENVIVEDGVLKITAKGTIGGASGVKHYYDDITLLETGGAASNLEDFEGTAPEFSGFGGASSTVIDNPDASGANTSLKVAESLKNNGAETWAGTLFDVTTPIDLNTYTSISVKTWSPAVGAIVKLKLENQANADEFFEVDALSTVENEWETLTFDFSDAPVGTYDRVVLFFDFGVSPVGDAAYTSARIKSENLYEFTYGRVEIRAKLPSAGGTWPALWALGANFDTVGWPACGEIDIMEHVGNNSNTTSSALHYTGNSGGNAVTGSTSVPTATSEFHNYTVEWTADSIKFVVDDELIHTSFVNSSDTPFNSDFFFIMNIAVGGTLGGTIDTAFTEDTMEVDYIRVYQ
ncbi:family 16 glycosylhydrolase [Zobellia uliginosa]|uniref:family 16 glycosylhydrolase n=1 Tax=Zobellia uliginosa TaxID=143224 RepID=UPI002090FCF3|nr:family 16 glycosylhydrolase [Zobellia uliginosa]